MGVLQELEYLQPVMTLTLSEGLKSPSDYAARLPVSARFSEEFPEAVLRWV